MPVSLESIADISIADFPFAAVIIGAVSNSQNHVGIGYRETGIPELSFLHLSWHYHPLSEDIPPNFFWIPHRISERRIRQVAARCRQIDRANPSGLPFAFSGPNGCFDADTCKYLFGRSQCGLTCATFVLAVFLIAGIELVRFETWPQKRSEDGEWQEWIISQLRNGLTRGHVTQEHIDDVQNLVGAVRCRPEEVAGASAAEAHPVSFDQAVVLASEVLALLRPPSAS